MTIRLDESKESPLVSPLPRAGPAISTGADLAVERRPGGLLGGWPFLVLAVGLLLTLLWAAGLLVVGFAAASRLFF